MLRTGFIKLLVLILAVLAVSPVCHALGNGLQGPYGDRPIVDRGLPGESDAFLLLPDEPIAEHCWMQQAHLFEAPALQGAYVPLIFVFLIVGLAALFVVVDCADYLRIHRKPPWRSPPSRSMLQIFRN